jgi:hypothetical protein
VEQTQEQKEIRESEISKLNAELNNEGVKKELKKESILNTSKLNQKSSKDSHEEDVKRL